MLGPSVKTKAIHNSPGLIYSRVLNFNIVQSERWLAPNEFEVNLQTIIGWHKATIMAPELSQEYISLRSQWPVFT